MNDPTIYSDLSSIMIVLGGIFLVMGIRWMLLKKTNVKYLALIMVCAIAELVLGGMMVVVG